MKDFNKYKEFIQELYYLYTTLNETEKRDLGEYIIKLIGWRINYKTTLIRLHRIFKQSFIDCRHHRPTYERNKKIYEDAYIQQLYKERKLSEKTN